LIPNRSASIRAGSGEAQDTFLIFAAALVPAATGALSFVGPGWSVALGVVGTVVVLAAQNYNLRAHAESKWQTAGDLRLLAGQLGALARKAEASGQRDVGTLDTELARLRGERESILARDRTRMSDLTPRKLEDAGLKRLGVEPTGGSGVDS